MSVALFGYELESLRFASRLLWFSLAKPHYILRRRITNARDGDAVVVIKVASRRRRKCECTHDYMHNSICMFGVIFVLAFCKTARNGTDGICGDCIAMDSVTLERYDLVKAEIRVQTYN